MPKTYRGFDNPLNLTIGRAFDRLYPLDNQVDVKGDNGILFVSSTLSDSAIQTALQNVNQVEPIEARKQTAIALLVSSGLAGRNLSTVNNNTDRDNLIKIICYLVGISDSTGLILATPAPVNKTPGPDKQQVSQ